MSEQNKKIRQINGVTVVKYHNGKRIPNEQRESMGGYFYEVRHSDSSSYPKTIEPKVTVNFAGTLHVKQPIQEIEDLRNNGKDAYIKAPSWLQRIKSNNSIL